MEKKGKATANDGTSAPLDRSVWLHSEYKAYRIPPRFPQLNSNYVAILVRISACFHVSRIHPLLRRVFPDFLKRHWFLHCVSRVCLRWLERNGFFSGLNRYTFAGFRGASFAAFYRVRDWRYRTVGCKSIGSEWIIKQVVDANQEVVIHRPWWHRSAYSFSLRLRTIVPNDPTAPDGPLSHRVSLQVIFGN